VSGCRRFETEGLLVLQQGGTLDEHFAACPECVSARAAYERLARRLGTLGVHEPPADWRDGVRAALDGGPGRRPVVAWAAAAAALALALAAGATLWMRPRATPEAVLTGTVESAPSSYRGKHAPRPGDVLVLRARVGDARVAELRLYQDDRRLVGLCAIAAPCVREDGVLTARFTLASAGAYQPLLVLSDRPLPAATGALDADAGAAHASGARALLGERVVVR
jgi:hypothetical protein